MGKKSYLYKDIVSCKENLTCNQILFLIDSLNILMKTLPFYLKIKVHNSIQKDNKVETLFKKVKGIYPEFTPYSQKFKEPKIIGLNFDVENPDISFSEIFSIVKNDFSFYINIEAHDIKDLHLFFNPSIKTNFNLTELENFKLQTKYIHDTLIIKISSTYKENIPFTMSITFSLFEFFQLDFFGFEYFSSKCFLKKFLYLIKNRKFLYLIKNWKVLTTYINLDYLVRFLYDLNDKTNLETIPDLTLSPKY